MPATSVVRPTDWLILDYVYRRGGHRPPEEVARALGLEPELVREHLRALQIASYVAPDPAESQQRYALTYQGGEVLWKAA